MTTQALPGLALDKKDTVELWQNHLAGIYQSAKGFRGAYALGNPGDHAGMTITFWDSEEDADNSGTFERVLLHIRDSLALQPVLDGYEILYHLEPQNSAGE